MHGRGNQLSKITSIRVVAACCYNGVHTFGVLQVEDNSQPFLARATMDRECPYDQTALSFKVSILYRIAGNFCWVKKLLILRCTCSNYLN